MIGGIRLAGISRGIRGVASKSKRNRRSRSGVVDEQMLASIIPAKDGRKLADLSPDEVERLKRVVASKRRDEKSAKASKQQASRARTERDQVSSPTVPGELEYIDRVIDNISQMVSRKQIDERQGWAAYHYRTCFQMQSAGAGGAMDFDRVRSPNGPAGHPPIIFLDACYFMDRVAGWLSPRAMTVVHHFCGLGASCDHIVLEILNDPRNRWPVNVHKVKGWLEDGLDVIADKLWPIKNERDRMTSSVTERASATDAQVVEQSTSIAHVTRDKVFWSGNPKKSGR